MSAFTVVNPSQNTSRVETLYSRRTNGSQIYIETQSEKISQNRKTIHKLWNMTKEETKEIVDESPYDIDLINSIKIGENIHSMVHSIDDIDSTLHNRFIYVDTIGYNTVIIKVKSWFYYNDALEGWFPVREICKLTGSYKEPFKDYDSLSDIHVKVKQILRFDKWYNVLACILLKSANKYVNSHKGEFTFYKEFSLFQPISYIVLKPNA